MDKFIATENIRRFSELLCTEKDEAARQILLQLLSKEEHKLTEAIAKEAEQREQTGDAAGVAPCRD